MEMAGDGNMSEQTDKKILLYGLQRSGTNYFRALATLNFPGIRFTNSEDRSAPAHKHFGIYDNKELVPEPQFDNHHSISTLQDLVDLLTPEQIPDLYCIVSKDPYSWYVSYCRWAEKNHWPEARHHYIETYNAFYGKWMQLSRASSSIVFFRYVDLLQDPGQAMQVLAERMGITFPGKIKTTKKVYASRRFSAASKKAFLRKTYLHGFGPQTLSEINALIDPELLAFLGYTREWNVDL